MIRLRLLGPLALESDDGGEVRPVLGQPKRLALLAYLAAVHPPAARQRDTLLGLFWPESDTQHARAALRQTLYQLRRSLGGSVLRSTGRVAVTVNRERMWCDAAAFESALATGRRKEALALYRGPFMDGFHLADAPRFERWVDSVRAHLWRLAGESALELGRHAAEVGRVEDAERWFHRAVELAPTDERAAATLIDFLLATGNRAKALQAYRAFEARLGDELRMEPTRALQDRVEELAPGGSPVSGLTIFSLPPAERRVASSLVERAQALVGAGPHENAAAREILCQATELDPTHGPAWIARARATARWIRELGGELQQAPSAVSAAGHALSLAPDSAQARVALGLALEAAARPHEAISAMHEALQIEPEQAEAHTVLARVLNYVGSPARSLRALRESSREGGDPSAALVAQRGLTEHVLTRWEEGDEAYGSLAHVPGASSFAKSPQVYFDLLRGREDRAARGARDLLADDPGGFVPRFTSGDVAVIAGDDEAAIRHFEHCYRMGPESRDAIGRSTRTLLGGAHLRSGDPARGHELLEAAERASNSALQAGATHAGIQHDLAVAHAARGEVEATVHWLERAYRAGWRFYYVLQIEPELADLVSDERVQRLADQMAREIRGQRKQVDRLS